MADTFNYRIDHHGSLIRPAELLAARRKSAAGSLDADALRAVEEEAVRESVSFQRKLRSTVVTDGDVPYEDFRGPVLDAVTGFQRTGEKAPDGLARYVAQSLPEARGPLLADRTARLTELTVIAPKVALPSPAYLAATTFAPELAASGGPSSARELGEALADLIRAEIELLVSRGVKLIQLNNPLLLGQVAAKPEPAGTGLSFADALAVDAATVRLNDRPEGVRIGVCPGWQAPAAVDRAGAERLYAGIPADRWILPFDKGTAAEADLLRALPEDRDVCLGVVDPATPGTEDLDTVLARLDCAGEIKDMEDMAIAPSRGFADVATRPLASAEVQRRKLVQVETLARYCWGNEF
ncbi:methionine synthase II (cobalamin-independent)-like protein [Streptomyces sp. KLOTTS4A1]|uniref:methionine synthase II (cobalamin-independent)-like protein n=1 Tax=Streptomyces sp. KLOTTS4A1 TaxID=3390996 RepID=UPI0039F5FB65